MSSNGIDRRNFFRTSSAAALALAAAGMPGIGQAQQGEKPLKLGFIGVGGRGTVLLRLAMHLDWVEVPAICDISERNLGRAVRLVERRGRPRPESYGKGPQDYIRMLEGHDKLDAVIIGTPWKWHVPMCLAAMEAGVYAGVEVPAAQDIDGCWQLVETCEKTGTPMMMLENYAYFRSAMMVMNLLDLDLFGNMLHCEVGYQKDERGVRIGPNGELSFYSEIETRLDGNLYPTHAIGPAAWAMGINRGDRFDYLVSVSSRSTQIEKFVLDKFGPDHPAAKIDFVTGDINTSIIRTAQGSTVTVYYDTKSPRPWDPILRFQSDKGLFMGSMDKIYVEGISKTNRAYEDAGPYYEKYDHPLWKKWGGMDVTHLGRGVSDFLCVQQFLEAARRKEPVPLNVYDAVAWSAITPLSVESVANGSAPAKFPEFSKGKWKEPQDRIYYGV